jgi:predicted RecA/RadA family phage recombinase
MARGHVNSGYSIPYTNKGTAVIASGDVVAFPNMIGVSLGLIAIGETGEVAVCQQWELPKASGLAINQGDQLYWDSTAKALNKTNTGVPAGKAVASAAASDAIVRVLLNW